MAGVALAAAPFALTAPAEAGTAVGSACAYRLDVSMFGGPNAVRGCGQYVCTGQETVSPYRALPLGCVPVADEAGAASPNVTLGGASQYDGNGARAYVGPAVFFGGFWDIYDNVPPSGALQASSSGTSTVQSIASGTTVGPSPFHADFVRGICTASDSGKTFSVQITGGVVETSTDPVTQEPTGFYYVGSSPGANTTVPFTIDHVGDSGRMIFNERIVSGNTTTLNASHMYMDGPSAVGGVVIGQAKCGH